MIRGNYILESTMAFFQSNCERQFTLPKCLTDNGKDFVISNFKIIKTRTFIPFKIRIKLFNPFYID